MSDSISLNYSDGLAPGEELLTGRGGVLNVVLEEPSRPAPHQRQDSLKYTQFLHWFSLDEDRVNCKITDMVYRRHPLGIDPSRPGFAGITLQMLAVVVAATHADSLRPEYRLSTHIVVWTDDDTWRSWNTPDPADVGVVGLARLLGQKISLPFVVRRKLLLPSPVGAGSTTLTLTEVDQDRALPEFKIPAWLEALNSHSASLPQS